MTKMFRLWTTTNLPIFAIKKSVLFFRHLIYCPAQVFFGTSHCLWFTLEWTKKRARKPRENRSPRPLLNNPALILADEPTGNLDTKTGEAVLQTFQQLHQKQGRTIVLITHEPYVAEHAERIIHIKDGEIVEDSKNHHRRLINNL